MTYIAATRSAPRTVSLLVPPNADLSGLTILQPPLRVKLADGREALALTVAGDPAHFECMGADDFERLLVINHTTNPTEAKNNGSV